MPNRDGKFHNPYHFIPVKGEERSDDLSVEEFRAGQLGHRTHDRYVSRTEDGKQQVFSGRIICRLITVTPVVIGASRDKDEKPARVEPFELEPGIPAIPASSLRGLISSTAEAASNSALRVLEDRLLSYRMSITGSPSALGMIVREGEDLRLRPLTLPTLQSKTREFRVRDEYLKVKGFPKALRVYIDGYKKVGQRITYATPSFLSNHEPNSYSADNREQYWYLPLHATSFFDDATQSLKETQPGDLKIKTVTKHGRQTHFLLGQNAVSGAIPISQQEYEGKGKPSHYTRGILRVLGIDGREGDIPTTKKHEFFIPYPPGVEKTPTLAIDNALNTFYELAAQRTEVDKELPYALKGSRRNSKKNPQDANIELRPGDIVHFDLDGAGEVKTLAVSSIWRGLVQGGGRTSTFFPAELMPFSKARPPRKTISIAENMFGFVGQQTEVDEKSSEQKTYSLALASRLRFSFGIAEVLCDEPYLPEKVAKILDSPKPPSPALYFKRRKGAAYITKQDLNPNKHEVQGRKVYLHQPEAATGETWVTCHLSGQHARLEQKSLVKPIKPEAEFYFHIDFDNLSQLELGLLCYALQPDKEFHHKLGMGKSLGLGTVQINPVGLFLINRLARYQEINLFEGRYHSQLVVDPEEYQKWPAQYEIEKSACASSQTQDGPSFEAVFNTLHKEFANLMDKDIQQALTLLGNPANVKHPVHTPLVQDQDREVETYHWFVINDDRKNPHKQFLKPLDKVDEAKPRLPTLEQY